MLFNSYIFLFLFLPLTLLVFFWIGHKQGTRMAGCWLTLASLFFYGWWNPKYLLLVVVSILVNYWCGVAINQARRGKVRFSPKALLSLGIAFNLGLLGYYKYAGFFVATGVTLFHADWQVPVILLPLAISFFTFTQVAYLVDAYHGVTETYDFLYYVLFVSFFPHLIAGPIVSYRRLMPQFARPEVYRFNAANFAEGLSLFTLGLAKKVLIADNLAPLAGHAFDRINIEGAPSFHTAWIGVLAYTFQLYFDFSGYSDMAIGLGRMFNVRFPLNFDSPYKARDIADFWRRWHITLSRFLRDHLYIPLGGNRHGEPRRYLNVLLTMLLGGLWHGAGWTFVIWGGLHGVYLMIHRAWQTIFKEAAWVQSWWMRAPWQGLTFLSVMLGWVFFRAHTAGDAMIMLSSMFGMHSWLPHGIAPAILDAAVIPAAQNGALNARLDYYPYWSNLGILVVAMAIAFFAPNCQEIFRVAENDLERPVLERNPTWKPNRLWAFLITAILLVTILNMSTISEFLYFKF